MSADREPRCEPSALSQALRAELTLERDQFEAAPMPESIAEQRQHLKTIVEDWGAMTDGEKKMLLARIFKTGRADHVNGALVITAEPRAQWLPLRGSGPRPPGGGRAAARSHVNIGADGRTRTRDAPPPSHVSRWMVGAAGGCLIPRAIQRWFARLLPSGITADRLNSPQRRATRLGHP